MFFIEELKEYDLILASRSPRRRQLLADCGLEFSLAGDYEVVEEYPRDLPADEVAAFLSRLKSEAYPEPLGGKDILITADTVVIAGRPYFGQTRRAGDGAGHVAEPFRTQSFGDYRGYAAQWKPQPHVRFPDKGFF